MSFYFKNDFRKIIWCCVATSVFMQMGNILFSQTAEAVQAIEEQPVNVNTNLVDSSIALSIDAGKNLIDMQPAKKEVAKKAQAVKPNNRTQLALAALSDNSLNTANNIAREELIKCTDFSTIDATLQFHIVMLFDIEKIYGPEKCLILLRSQTSFAMLWGDEAPKSIPSELVESIAFWEACCLSDLNKQDEAIDILQKLLDANNFKFEFLRVEVLRRLCYELLQVGQFEEALALFATPDLPPVTDELCGESVALFRMSYARTLFLLGKTGESELEIKKIVDELSSQPVLKATALLFNVEQLLAENKATKAIELFEKNNDLEDLNAATPRVKALLLCKYAQSLALDPQTKTETINSAVAAAIESVDMVYSSEERMICLETLIQVLAKLKRFDDVRIRLAGLIEYAPNSSYVARILRQIARNYFTEEEYEQAYWIYQLYLHSFSNDEYEYDVLLDSGDCLIEFNRPHEAALQFKRAGEITSDTGKKNLANFKAGSAYYKSERYMLAADCFASIVAIAEDKNDSIYISSQLYHAKAIERFDTVTAKLLYKQLANSDVLELKEPSLIAAAALSVDDGELNQALEFYSKLIELTQNKQEKGYAIGLLGRGFVELKTGHYADALKSFELAEKVEKGAEFSIRSAFLKTEALYSLGQEDLAYSNTVAFLEKFPKSPLVIDAEFWLAKYNFNIHKYDQAEARFLTICEKWRDSKQAPISYLLAIYSMLEQKKYSDVITHTTKWSDIYDDASLLAEIQFVNGEARSQLLQFDRAALSFAQASKNASNQSLKLRSMMRQADCLYTLGADNVARYEEAIPIYKELMLTPGQERGVVVQMAYKLAKCYEKLGQNDLAINGYYVNVILQVENWASEASGTNVVDYLNAIGGSVWYARAVVDAAALYEKEGSFDSLKSAEAILGRIIGTQLPCVDEAKLSLERIKGRFLKMIISTDKK